MINSFLSQVSVALTALLITLGVVAPAPVQDIIPSNDNLGASIPKVVANFETSLASKITAAATSMTLVRGTDDAGNTLSGYTCFTLDEGLTTQEFVCGTASSTSVTGMIRGVDPQDGDLEVASLKHEHRIGSSVKVTDYPVIGIIARILSGQETLPTWTPTDPQHIITKGYADALAIAGAPDSSTSTKGISKLSTAAASSTNPIAVGDNDPRIPTQDENDALVGASSTPSSSNPLTDKAYVDYVNSFSIASSSITLYTASSTYTKPAKLLFIEVELTGGGGGSGGSSSSLSPNTCGIGYGGGSAGYAKKIIPASDLSATTSIKIGNGGTGASAYNTNASNGTSSEFGSFVIAYGGNGAQSSSVGTGGSATTTGSGIAISGESGLSGGSVTSGLFITRNGGRPLLLNYGGGATGGQACGGSNTGGQNGTNGAMIIKEYFSR